MEEWTTEAMMTRRLQERTMHPDGSPLTEWDDTLPPAGWELPAWGATDKDWRDWVRNLNKTMKMQGDNTRFRTVEADSEVPS